MDAFMLFSNLTGIRLNEQDFFIDGHQVNPWELYRTVSLRNSFDSVRFHDHTISFSQLMRHFPNFLNFFLSIGNYEWRMVHGRCRSRFSSSLLR